MEIKGTEGAGTGGAGDHGVELSFDYDDAGRPAEQKVTGAPTGLEGDRLIAYDHGYDDCLSCGTRATAEHLRARPDFSRLPWHGRGYTYEAPEHFRR